MDRHRHRSEFTPEQIETVNQSVNLAEELVSNYYKMSTNQWLRPRYDVKTLAELDPEEIVAEPFAQIIRYQGKPKGATLGSETYDFYKICIQDHNILNALKLNTQLPLSAFCVYIVVHELIHIVRFSRFLQSFDANTDEIMAEEKRVHTITHDIISKTHLPGMDHVLQFYKRWRKF
jgi:hypothetical protein